MSLTVEKKRVQKRNQTNLIENRRIYFERFKTCWTYGLTNIFINLKKRKTSVQIFNTRNPNLIVNLSAKKSKFRIPIPTSECLKKLLAHLNLIKMNFSFQSQFSLSFSLCKLSMLEFLMIHRSGMLSNRCFINLFITFVKFNLKIYYST